jgi:DNA ligase (NAD+)
MSAPTPFDSRESYEQAVAAATAAATSYYDSDQLLMSDHDYDQLVARISATEQVHGYRSAVTTQVAAGASDGGDVTHSEPMLSLDNVFSPEELVGWYQRLCDTLGGNPVEVCVEPKLDGLAVAARYVDGVLDKVITRGDGTAGEDVTDTATEIGGLPRRLAGNLTIEVRGEVFMSDADFEVANANRTAAGSNPFANPRNAAAGTLRSRSRTYEAPLSFAAYQCVGMAGHYGEQMAALADAGLTTASSLVGGLVHASSEVELDEAIRSLEARRAELGFAIDGAVIKAASHDDRSAAGSNSRAPRWAIAYKYPADSALTELLGIDLDVGRTGIIAPRAVLAPVHVGGTTITSATLHNPGEIERLDIRIGDQVWVLRAGEVIPRVTGPNVALRPDDATPWEPPTNCPRCGSDIDRSEKRWRCVQGRTCNLLASLEYWCARDCLDIEGAGSTLLRKLVDADMVSDVADLYSLTVEQLCTLDRVGATSAAALVEQLEKSKSQPFARVFCGLGIRYTGRSMSRRLTAEFPTMELLRSASAEQLAEIDGVGPVRASSIVSELVELTPLIDRLSAAGVSMGAVPSGTDEPGARPLAGRTVVVSGAVPGMSRNEANEAVERLGGRSTSSVSKNTSLLVAGAGAGSKVAKAEGLGVEVMTAEEFAELVAANDGHV